MVLESGSHTLEDGTVVVAGNSNVTHLWSNISLGSNFSSTPVVVSQTITENGIDAIMTRHQNVTAGSFDLRMQEDQRANQTHTTETVSWIAVEPAVGTSNGSLYEAGNTGVAVTHNNFNLSFASGFAAPPVFLASMQTFNGPDPAYVRYNSLSASDAVIYLDEEQSRDGETNHIAEDVGYFALESGAIFGLLPPGNRPFTGGGGNDSLSLVDSTVGLQFGEISGDSWQSTVTSPGGLKAIVGESSELNLAGSNELAKLDLVDRHFEQLLEGEVELDEQLIEI